MNCSDAISKSQNNLEMQIHCQFVTFSQCIGLRRHHEVRKCLKTPNERCTCQVRRGWVKLAPYFFDWVGPYLISQEASQGNLGPQNPNLAKKTKKNSPRGQNGEGQKKKPTEPASESQRSLRVFREIHEVPTPIYEYPNDHRCRSRPSMAMGLVIEGQLTYALIVVSTGQGGIPLPNQSRFGEAFFHVPAKSAKMHYTNMIVSV